MPTSLTSLVYANITKNNYEIKLHNLVWVKLIYIVQMGGINCESFTVLDFSLSFIESLQNVSVNARNTINKTNYMRFVDISYISSQTWSKKKNVFLESRFHVSTSHNITVCSS